MFHAWRNPKGPTFSKQRPPIALKAVDSLKKSSTEHPIYLKELKTREITKHAQRKDSLEELEFMLEADNLSKKEHVQGWNYFNNSGNLRQPNAQAEKVFQSNQGKEKKNSPKSRNQKANSINSNFKSNIQASTTSFGESSGAPLYQPYRGRSETVPDLLKEGNSNDKWDLSTIEEDQLLKEVESFQIGEKQSWKSPKSLPHNLNLNGKTSKHVEKQDSLNLLLEEARNEFGFQLSTPGSGQSTYRATPVIPPWIKTHNNADPLFHQHCGFSNVLNINRFF